MTHRHYNKPFSQPSTPADTDVNAGSLIILHVNMQSLKNKITEMKSYLADRDFDMVCFSEHWLSEDEARTVIFNDLIYVDSYCRSLYRGGRVAMYGKNITDIKPLLCVKDFSIEK